MLTKPTIQQVTVVHGLVHQPAWQSFSQILHSELEASIERLLNTADSATVHELRGRAKMLNELLAFTTGTRALLDSLSKK